ncbi:alpha-D-ribose 1-methylphosphonate 5-triphosphate synthase subunit PhnH [Methylobacterium phyllostachyos]|uniref:Alpha-D-ribose 1-methylphosphonate 5-triphosphate synthase subunit PhnH n=1 Tax=Methylobacterium phyllostachyos TaxID=582672 RepID=A0A1H0GZF5_9HYPH|nr:phosphonate C-P lyase system protein PhnH [Methylobacterium phyllostachyos]SDO12164.1 alpha-D-ribose 1-methylphosphonate 5-triphosphate synthase subunit PhnH [Methylobacterium phyllostachyos]
MLAPGFADPVHDAQATFRAVMEALARPGLVRPLAPGLQPPAPLTPELAAIALTLTDADTPVWLDPPLAEAPEVAAYLRFHTGAPLTDDPARAAFALVRDPARCPPLGRFAPGTPAYPDTSTTLVLALDAITVGEGLHLTGPGIRGAVRMAPTPLPDGFVGQLAANRADFPLGVDLILTAPGRVAGLPRSTTVTEA